MTTKQNMRKKKDEMSEMIGNSQIHVEYPAYLTFVKKKKKKKKK